MSQPCKAQQQRDGSWVCRACGLGWDRDEERPECVTLADKELNKCYDVIRRNTQPERVGGKRK